MSAVLQQTYIMGSLNCLFGGSPFRVHRSSLANQLSVPSVNLHKTIDQFRYIKNQKHLKEQTILTQFHALARTYTHAHNRLHPSNYNASTWSNLDSCFDPLGLIVSSKGGYLVLKHCVLKFGQHTVIY